MLAKLALVLVALVVVVLVGGGVVLSFWDIPAPATKIEKVLPDARFAS
jgi:hypothetical protein